MMTKPNSLVVRRYKARYFPNSSLFDSKIRHNPSYAWRCIWKARHILMHGCRWSIGSGTSIRVMDDPWLRGNDGAWIPSPYTRDAYNLRVSDLMVQNMKVWDKGKIESIFPLHVAKRIFLKSCNLARLRMILWFGWIIRMGCIVLKVVIKLC
jgi:hypothetical protein